MTLSRRERKKTETRRKILDQAITLFRRDGIDAVTMETIAAAADVAKGTLYNYFPEKEALLAAWMQALVGEAQQEITRTVAARRTVRTRLMALLQKFEELLRDHRPLVRAYVFFRFSSPDRLCGDVSLRSGVNSVVEEILLAGQEKGEIRRDIDVVQLAVYFESLLFTTLLAWLGCAESLDLDSEFARMTSVFIDGAAHRGRD